MFSPRSVIAALFFLAYFQPAVYGGRLTQGNFDDAEAMTQLSSHLRKRLSKRPGHVQKHVIYFIGDSLIRNQYAALCAIVNSRKVPDIGLGHKGFLRCDSDDLYALFFYTEVFAKAVVKDAISHGHPVPSVIYLHVGTHLLHLHPARPMSLDMFTQLNNYSGMLADVLTSFQQSAPRARLNVMTTFSICENMYSEPWSTIAIRSNQNPSMAAEPCATEITQKGIDKDVAQRVCEQFFFTRAGSLHIRDQVVHASDVNGLSGSRAVVVDMWKLTDGHCDMCDDGRHYNRMVLNQLDALFTANEL
jgi:hypothetical protein